MKFPVFDLHCDSAFALMGEDFSQYGSLKSNSYHFDLTRAGKNAGFAQCFACMSTTMEGPWSKMNPVVFFERQLATIQREIDKNSKIIRLAYSANDVKNNLEKGIMSAILTLEGAAGFSFDPELLPDLYAVGFRMTTLGWNESNPLAGSHLTGEGLTEMGVEYVKQAQKCGMIVDVSHISDKAFYDIMDITQAPVVASHSNSRTICSNSRNLTDDMFLQICKTGGTAGLNLYTQFIGDNADLELACDHVLHFLELDPDGAHISLGGDLDGCDSLCSGFHGVEDYPLLAQKLSDRGVDATLIQKIFWDNALGVMEKCCM